MEIRGLMLNPADNVAIVVQPVQPGDVVFAGEIRVTATEEIHTGHKIAVAPVAKDGNVIKYGTTIGRASQDIPVGAWVHTHNVIDCTEELCNAYAAAYRAKIREEETRK